MSAGHGSGGHGRSKRKVHEEEHENHERWAVSYADMMTVLVGLFIVLYAMSQVDQTKFEELRESLAAGFGHRAPSLMEGSSGAMAGVENIEITPDLLGETGVDGSQVTVPETEITEAERNASLAQAEYERLDAIAQQISDALARRDLDDQVRFRITERGLMVGLVADDVFFAPDTANLTKTAKRVLDVTGPVLSRLPDQISVEGHANVLPTKRYPTNWELSSDRATQVLRRLVERGHVAPTRIAAVGFGEARPLQDTGGLDALDANRRVDLVVLSGVPDDVRVLLPSIAANQG